MSKFKQKMKNKSTIGNKQINSDDAMGLVFETSDKKLSNVKISALETNPFQPRHTISIEELQGLADSISSNGLLQPIIISPIDNSPRNFYVVAGHRRVEAHKLLNISEIEAVILPLSESELQIYSIIENIQREDLSVYEESLAISNLTKSGLTNTDIKNKLGLSDAYVSKLLKISKLNTNLTNYIQENSIRVGISIMYELTKIPGELQLDAFKYFQKNSMKREQIQLYIKQLTSSKSKHFSPVKKSFIFKSNPKQKKFSFSIDLNKLDTSEKEEAIKNLEMLISELKEEVK